MVFNLVSSRQWTCHPTLCLAHCKLSPNAKIRRKRPTDKTLPNYNVIGTKKITLWVRFFPGETGCPGCLGNGCQILCNLCHEHWLPVHGGGERYSASMKLSKAQVLPTQLRGQGMALVNVMSMFSQMASPVFVYSVGVQSPSPRLLFSQTLQSVVSEGAPFLLIALVCLLASIPGKMN